jgi:hypothetical protein
MVLMAREEPAGAGFHTTVLPKRSAGVIFPRGMARGLFQGVIMEMTPKDRYRITESALQRISTGLFA